MMKIPGKFGHVILLMAFGLLFLTACNGDDPEPDFTTITDIEGNVYRTVVIGEQEWMAENLRATKYNNGAAIPAGLSNEEWENTTQGAYAIYPHDSIPGFSTDKDVLEAYGALYNWYAVNTGNLCPEGWAVPTDDDWTQLVDYLMETYDLHNFWGIYDIDGVGNALKSCRQTNSPLGGGCNTSRHPRWDAHPAHYGMDDFGLSLLPGGGRSQFGFFFLVGRSGSWWSADEHSTNYAWSREADSDVGSLIRFFPGKSTGLSVRCIKD